MPQHADDNLDRLMSQTLDALRTARLPWWEFLRRHTLD
ncbi:hypothetical protein GA0074692_2641 [Micromonospora pallida]|uniref:Uncharacterized protein n=1 Tax=Micromonospora pallida TaxID=145854 RepID=A0A1C6SI64_9ACTN|nr:hypothetical protein GA0074692_2641 [Micromonospora pallida]